MGVGQVRATHVAHPLLLPGAALSHVDGHPRRPGRVPLHLWTRLQVAGLVLLNEKFFRQPANCFRFLLRSEVIYEKTQLFVENQTVAALRGRTQINLLTSL